jgi:SAM-dependent methyltransferase
MNTRKILIDLGLSTHESIELYHHRVRDAENLPVYKCSKSGVIFLHDTRHISKEHYAEMEDLHYWKSSSREEAMRHLEDDTNRRVEQFLKYVLDKDWVDIGTGIGALLDQLSPYAKSTIAIEPQLAARTLLQQLGHKVLASTDELPDESVDIATLFHVVEHFTEPIDELTRIASKVKPGGKIIIEVPHASDFLLSFLDNQSFKEFTLWSEHIILHTRKSLEIMLSHCGWKPLISYGVQRYPLANHLHWLAKGKPGGHQLWSALRSTELDKAYENMLAKLDMTDTLICIAEKPE